MPANGLSYYCDGALDASGQNTGVAVVARGADGRIHDAASCRLAGMTNNEAEYEALILGLELALAHGATQAAPTFVVDSQVVLGQLAGQFAVRDPRLAALHGRAMALLERLPDATLRFAPREQNRLADALAAEAARDSRPDRRIDTPARGPKLFAAAQDAQSEPANLYAAVCAPATLQQAWLEVWGGRTWAARGQGAGVDGVTLVEWAQEAPDRLAQLHADLTSGRYRPGPLLWFDTARREPGKRRRLGIPTVTDRVAQRAAKNVLEPIWEARFLPCSHGFRPERSVYTAVAHVLRLEAAGRRWVADADIEACFDHIDHERLLTMLAEFDDMRLLSLIAGWVETGSAAPGTGIAQGAVISPLLTNIYLHPFDAGMTQAGHALVRYADDFVVLCADRSEARRAMDEASRVLAGLDLRLNPSKSRIVPFGPAFTFLGAQFEG